MPYLHEFLMLTLVHFLAVISPGPDFAIVIRQSVHFGRKTAIITSLGIGTGIAIHVTYTLLGIGFLITQSPSAFMVAKIGGTLYLTYLGIKLLLNSTATTAKSTENKPIKADTNKNHKSAFMLGFMTNLLNPKATLFFLAIFTTVVSIKTPLAVQSLYGSWLIISTASWFCLVSFFFSQNNVREKFIRHGYLFDRLMGIVLLMFAVKLAIASL